MFLHNYLELYESIEWIVGAAAAGVSVAFAWLWTRRAGARMARPVGAASLAV